MDDAISKKETAAIFGVTPRTLTNWKKYAYGPKCKKVGGNWIYSRNEVESFADKLRAVKFHKRGGK